MTKAEFEAWLNRAGKIAEDADFYLIGSRSLRGVSPAIPRDFPKTFEADLYPRTHPQAWSLLRAELGNPSKFFTRYGCYLDGTDPGLATLPEGWTERLLPFRTPRTGGVTAWCLEPHDLFASKLVAGREKDRQFLRAMLRHQFVRLDMVRRRVDELPISSTDRLDLLEKLGTLTMELPKKGSPKKA